MNTAVKLLKIYHHELPLQDLSDGVRLELIELNTQAIREHGLSFLNIGK